jgi:tripartite-type tricarboxylate transporter receptor subunit TctC
VHKDVPADVREKIAAVAQKVVESDAAKELSAETGALVYWQGADAAADQIEQDAAALGNVMELIEQ